VSFKRRIEAEISRYFIRNANPLLLTNKFTQAYMNPLLIHNLTCLRYKSKEYNVFTLNCEPIHIIL